MRSSPMVYNEGIEVYHIVKSLDSSDMPCPNQWKSQRAWIPVTYVVTRQKNFPIVYLFYIYIYIYIYIYKYISMDSSHSRMPCASSGSVLKEIDLVSVFIPGLINGLRRCLHQLNAEASK